MQCQPGAAQFAGAYLQPKPMKVDDGGNDRQAQPEAWVPVTFLAAIEPLQYRRTFLFRNPRAAVLNGDVQALVVLRR